MMKFSTLRRYYDTLKYLKPEQFIYRLKYRLTKPQVIKRPSPEYRHPAVFAGTVPWIPASVKFAMPDRFSFLNKTAIIQNHADWNAPEHDKLWLYNLHYFDWLQQDNMPSEQAVRWTDKWISGNPPCSGNGWEPYPVSLRIVNWIKRQLTTPYLSDTAINSMAMQVRILSQRLEFHLLGNHLLANAKAMVFAGLFFQGPDADKWLETGIAIYRRELPEQILADGGHFELSPMYHSIILEDILDLINLGNRFQNQLLQELPLPEIAGRMLSWLSGMCHQDGQISFFNDAATGIAPHPFWLFNYAKSLGVHYAKASSNVYFGESGYFRLSANKIMIIADIGQVGPDYQPGHAHADTLSFEMSYDGQRVLVNTGTSCYGSGSERIYQRSTPAHNAVTVDGLNSSEVWDGHRVARRAGILSRSFSSRNACAAHNGFARVIPDCIHSRCWKLSDNQVEITDRINGYGEHRISIYWHFHPDIKVDCLNKHRFTLSVNNVIKGHMICSEDYTSYIYSGYYAPEFGKMIMNSTVLLEKKCQFPTITKTVFEFVQ